MNPTAFLLCLSVCTWAFIAIWLLRNKHARLNLLACQCALAGCLVILFASALPRGVFPRFVLPQEPDFSQAGSLYGNPSEYQKASVVYGAAHIAEFSDARSRKTEFDYGSFYLLGVWAVLLWWATGALWALRIYLGSTAAPIEIQVMSKYKIRMSKDARIPLCIGVPKGLILLPLDASEWSSEALDFVIKHEEGHLKNRDHIWLSLAQLLCCLQWFNPMAWLLMRKMRLETERVADDEVILAGGSITDYAQLLLDFCAKYSSHTLRWMVQPLLGNSNLSKRVKRILNPKSRRSSGNPKLTRATVGIAVLACSITAYMSFSRLAVATKVNTPGSFASPGHSTSKYIQNFAMSGAPGSVPLEILQVSMLDKGKVIAWNAEGAFLAPEKITPADIHSDDEPSFAPGLHQRWRTILLRIKGTSPDKDWKVWVPQPSQPMNNDSGISSTSGFKSKFLYDRDGWQYFAIQIGITRQDPSLEPFGLKVLPLDTIFDHGAWVYDDPIQFDTLPSGKKIEKVDGPPDGSKWVVPNAKDWCRFSYTDVAVDDAIGEQHLFDVHGNSLDDKYCMVGTWVNKHTLREDVYVAVRPEEFKEIRFRIRPTISGQLQIPLSPQ